MQILPKVLVITGPTATGKTKLGILLAKKFGGEIISADSMQIYKGMTIGTAAPIPSEMDGVEHHLVGIISPKESYSAACFVEDAARTAEDIISRGKLPIIVGGTWLYIDSLVASRDFMGGDNAIRAEFSARYDTEGAEAMLKLLAECDPQSAERLHKNDKKRIVRALEVYYSTGKTITQHNLETRARSARFDALWIALNYEDRKTLYERINARVDKMLADGLVDEVKALLEAGIEKDSTAMQAIGYKQICDYLEGKMPLSEAAECIKIQSRRYAKRQLSWLNQKDNINWIIWKNEPDFQKACHCSTIFVENYGII